MTSLQKDGRRWELYERKTFLEDDDVVRVSKVIVNSYYGLNAVLVGGSIFIADMTFGEFKNRYDRGDFPSDDGVCEFRYDVMPL